MPHLTQQRVDATPLALREFFSLFASAIFLVIYPGFFFYHFFAGQGFIKPILAGLYGPALLFALPVSIIAIALKLNRLSGTTTGMLFLLFLAWTSICIAVFGHMFPTTYLSSEVNYQYFSSLILYCSLFYVGFYISFDHKITKILCIISIAVIFIMTTTKLDYTMSSFNYNINNDSNVASYQGLARSLLFTGLYLFSVLRNRTILVAALCIVALFFIGARSEFVAFLCVFAVLTAIRFRSRPVAALAVIAAAITASFWISGADLSGMQSRHLKLLDLTQDTSWGARSDMLRFALEQVRESPILGIYGGHSLYGGGGLGSYAHNIISAWASFGLIGFLIYGSLIISSLAISLRALLSNPEDSRAVFCFTVSMTVAILVVFAKSIFWAEPALAWGAVTAIAVRQIRSAPKSSRRDMAGASRAA